MSKLLGVFFVVVAIILAGTAVAGNMALNGLGTCLVGGLAILGLIFLS